MAPGEGVTLEDVAALHRAAAALGGSMKRALEALAAMLAEGPPTYLADD